MTETTVPDYGSGIEECFVLRFLGRQKLLPAPLLPEGTIAKTTKTATVVVDSVAAVHNFVAVACASPSPCFLMLSEHFFLGNNEQYSCTLLRNYGMMIWIRDVKGMVHKKKVWNVNVIVRSQVSKK